MTHDVDKPRIANATTGLEITEEMISAAADVLYFDPQVDLPRGWTEKIAEEMLRHALQVFVKGSSEGDR